MNDSIGVDGITGGHNTPTPSIEYPPVSIDVDSVAGFGTALGLQAGNIGDAKGGIKSRMGLDEGGKYSAAGLPVGGGNQNLTLTRFAAGNAERMAEIGTFLDNVETGLRNLSNLTAALVAEFGDRDALNAVDIDEVKAVIAAGDPSNGTEA